MTQLTLRRTELTVAVTVERGATRPGAVLAVVCAGVVLASLDMFIVNVALPDISVAFGHSGLSSLSWVLNAYTVVFAALLVPAGRLADRTGRKQGFLLGVTIFTIASAACAAASDVGMLVAFRIVQAAGAALLMPTSLSLVLAAYPAERRAGAVRIWTATGGFAAALGPVAGGLLVALDWRWVFLVNVPVGVAAVVVGRRVLPSITPAPGRMPDLVGAGVLTAGVAALTLGLVEAHSWGWSSGRIIAAFAVAAACLGIFLWRCTVHHTPIVELDMLQERSFAVACTSMVLFSTAFGAMLLSAVLWLQDDWGWSALRTGLAIAPGPLMVPGVSLLSGRLVRRTGSGPVIALGATLFAAGMFWWAGFVGLHGGYAADVLPGLIVSGIGVGLTLPTLYAAASASLPPQRFATGSGVLNMARQLGFTIGVAVLVAILGAPHSAEAALHAFRHGRIAIGGAALAAAAVALLLPRPRPVTAATGASDVVAAPVTAGQAA